MDKTYPFVLNDCMTDGEVCLGYYSRGHHPADLFLAEVHRMYAPECGRGEVRHIYCSFVPVKGHSYDIAMYLHDTKGRGRVPITWIDEEE